MKRAGQEASLTLVDTVSYILRPDNGSVSGQNYLDTLLPWQLPGPFNICARATFTPLPMAL